MNLRVYIGYDPRDDLAYRVCVASLRAKSSVPLSILPLKEWELRESGLYYRSYIVDERGQMFDQKDGKPFSTMFSFSRFLVPALEQYDSDMAIYIDPDMLVRADIAKLAEHCRNAPEEFSVFCVQHSHIPTETMKMWGVQQTIYSRKNWSSLMVFRPWKCQGLTKHAVNMQTGSWLHGMCWARDDEIGSLNQEWNWLVGYSSPEIEPAIAHFTLGTPDMKGRGSDAYAAEWWEYANKCAG